MPLYGYARVSTLDQDLTIQQAAAKLCVPALALGSDLRSALSKGCKYKNETASKAAETRLTINKRSADLRSASSGQTSVQAAIVANGGCCHKQSTRAKPASCKSCMLPARPPISSKKRS